MKDGISLCVIAKDEESNPAGGIINFFRHNAKFGDEVVFVDTGSKDRTVEIARSFNNVQLFNYDWADDFSGPRNYAIEQASYNRILFLDADERLVPISEYVALLSQDDQFSQRVRNRTHLNTYIGDLQVYGHEFPFINVTKSAPKVDLEKMSGMTFTPVIRDGCGYEWRIRLFQNLPFLRYNGSVHELLIDTTQADQCLRNQCPPYGLSLDFAILHFLPDNDRLRSKEEFYNGIKNSHK